MNSHSNFIVGFKKELLTVCVACGFIPYKYMDLLNPNRISMNHMALEYIEEGFFEKYHDKEIWILAPTQRTRDSIFKKNIGDKNSLYDQIPESLKAYYKKYSQDDFYKLKKDPKKYESRRIRVFRNGEVFTFFYGMRYDTLPGEKKTLQELLFNHSDKITNSTFFPFRELVNIDTKIYFNDEEYKISDNPTNAINVTKVNGLISLKNSESTYATIVTGKKPDQYTINGEKKALIYINNILSQTTLPQPSGCLIFYSSDVPLQKLLYYSKLKEQENAEGLFNNYNDNVFCIPLTPKGQEFVKIMDSSPFWKEELMGITIKKEWQTNKSLSLYVCYDGTNFDEEEGVTYYHFNFLIPNLARLKKFFYFASTPQLNARYCLYCFEFQEEFLKKVVPCNIKIMGVPLDVVKERLGLITKENPSETEKA